MEIRRLLPFGCLSLLDFGDPSLLFDPYLNCLTSFLVFDIGDSCDTCFLDSALR